MKLSIREKKVLYDFACPNHHNTVTRLKWLTALTVDPQAKHRMLELARKMEMEVAESWYTGFYHQLRAEMDEYYRAKRRLRLVKENTDYEEDLYDEAMGWDYQLKEVVENTHAQLERAEKLFKEYFPTIVVN